MNNNVITERLIADGESERVAFVTAADAWDEIARHVCAFLNGNGGTVVIGVDPLGKIGSEIAEDDANAVRRALHVDQQITPQALFTVNWDDTPAGKVVSVDVPAG